MTFDPAIVTDRPVCYCVYLLCRAFLIVFKVDYDLLSDIIDSYESALSIPERLSRVSDGEVYCVTSCFMSADISLYQGLTYTTLICVD